MPKVIRLNAKGLILLNHGVREDSWESLAFQEIKLVNPKGNQLWIFIRRINAEAEALILLATWCKELTHWKRPWFWKRLKAGGEWGDRGWDGWMASPTQWPWEFEQAPGDDEGQGSQACCSPWCCKESHMTYQLSNNSKVIRQEKPR